MRLVRTIFLGSFWSFLFVLSGLVDAGIGIASYFTGALGGRESAVPTYVICFIVGAVYLAIGFTIAVLKMRREGKA